MAVGCILRVSWFCLLLFGGSLPFPSMKGYSYTSDNPEKVPLAAAPKQAPLNPEEGPGIQGGGAVEFGQKNAEIEDQKLVKPVTFPLNPPNQHDYSFEEQWGSTKPQFPPSDTNGGYSSSALYLDVQAGSQSYSPNLVYEDFSQYPAVEAALLPSTDDDPYTYDSVEAEQSSSWSSDRYITIEEPAFSSNAGNWAQAAQTISAQILEAEAVPSTDTKGGDSSSSLHLDLPSDVQEGSQSYSPNLVYEDVFQYPAAETAQLPSEQSDFSDFNSVNVVQPSTWSSAPYMTREEEPVYVSNSGDWAQAAPTISEQTLEAEAVPSTDTKGGETSSSLNLNFQAGAQEGSQSYSPNLVDEAVYQYPAAEAEQLHSEGVDASKYDSMNAVQPSTWSSASYMTREEEPVFSSHTGHWAHVAPVETPAYPSFVADFVLDSTSSKAAAQPVLFKPPKKAPQLPSSKWLQRPKKVRDQTASTYVVQSKGSHRRSRQMLSKKKYFSGFPPPPPSVLMALRP
ncbi:uncharacterized protein LOC130403425 [Gadus chalcogrammus]|uniref:uncharacterized protein LOC130403425 n=1 Tax=Gadus chalcogrammus TaxID=1042646 RepID=UPI0024C2CB25|nr:uncharacterized protein LOC130403425 [Gadus chalcogrammus]